ncbi:MAG TPA: CAP domain-containing protein [Thermoanaerobaculia bacterium]|nr:CAP domain-containing protein [Thermoanaerobaculia bacterium]
MKRFLFFGTLTATLLALFLLLRPAVSAIGSPAVPDTVGRAKELLPEERAGGAAATATTTVAGPKPVAGPPMEVIEQQVLALTNEARRTAGLPPVALDESLRRAARSHARDMIDRGFTDSINPDGLTAEDRVSRENRRAVALVGETLGAGSVKDAELARHLVADWAGNPTEREKVLRPDFTQIGVGVVPSGDEVRAVQLFGRTVALTDTPIPEKVAAGSTVRVVLAAGDPSLQCSTLDVFAPDTGLAAVGPLPFGDVAMNVAPGVYRLRIQCAGNGSTRIYSGPRIEVTR